MKRTKQFVILLLTLLFFAGGGEMKAESATAAFTGTESTNFGKTLPFDYEFTASGSSVTLTISNVNGTDIAGLNTTPLIYEWTTGVEQGRGQAMTYTWNNFVPTTPLRVKLHWQAENGDFISDYLIYPENLTSGKTVVPLGGLKSFLPVGAVTADNLQKITQDGNTDNVYLFPENGANLDNNKALGIQGFYIDLGVSKSIGAIQSTWESADCGANIYLTNTEPAADGSLTGETLIATFDNAQEIAKNVTVTVENSGRYIVFVPTTATNYAWGVKIRTFAAFERQSSVLTSFVVNPSYVEEGVATELTLSPKDQYGMVLSNGVSYTVSSGTLEGNRFTANSAGNVTITATYGGVSKTATIYVVQKPVVSAEVVNVSSKTATINYWLLSGDNTATGADDEIIFTVKQGTEVVSEATYQKNMVVGENNKVALNLTGLAPNTTYTYTVTATHRASGLSSETSVTFTTQRLGGDLKIKFSADGQEYLGFTGDLEKLITENASTQLNDVTTLFIDGPLNSEDIKTLRTMAGGKYQIKESDYATNQGSLATLNMEAATFVADNGIFVETYYENGQTVRWDPVYLTEAGSNMYNYIFYGCKNLVTVVLPTGVERLGEYSFFKCENLENINTVNVKVFDRSCFQGDTKLGQITISDGCTRLAYAAFSLCKSMTLTNTVLPSSITQLADLVFQNCEALTEITYPNNAALAETAQEVFQNCSNLVTLNMPSTTRTIEYTFCQNCTNLVNLNFYNAENSSQTGPEYNNVLNIIACAFDNCNKLSDVSVAAFTHATLLGWNAFQNCDQISTTTVNQLLAQITDGSDTKSGGITIRDNDDYTVAASLFANCDGFTSVTIPSQIVRIEDQAFVGCSNLETITIGENVASTGILVFANCTKLHKVNVSRGVAPTCDKTELSEVKQEKQTIDGEEKTVDVTYYYNIFNNVPANQVTLNFTADATSTSAESGYKTYRAQKHFMYLLTKTLDEVKESYDVAGQMHADVVLKRKMVEGWNTVALPFGVKADSNRDRDYTAAGVYQKAFNGTGEEGDKFMIAAYRGIEKDVFKFLKYSSYTTDPLDEFEPLLIRMGSGNISDEYTFVDVDLNYDAEENKLYRDGNAAEEVPVKRWDTESSSFKGFIGNNYNHDWSQFKETSDGFAFTGTYSTKTTVDKGDNFNYTRDYFIKPGDYIIQSNLFYEVLASKKYGLKGFRAWFQKQEQDVTGTARPAQLKFSVVELDDDTPTEIESFDTVDNDVKPFDVYSIGGQLLRKQTKSLNGLPNGIYIVNGRKVAVGK